MRARKLLKLGIATEITNIINLFDENIILGHLFNLRKISIFEQEKLKNSGEKFFAVLQEYDKSKVKFLTTKEKKARNHKLITVGALFEIANVTEFNLAVIIGFLNSLYEKDEYYLSQCSLQGKLYFLKKGVEKNGIL